MNVCESFQVWLLWSLWSLLLFLWKNFCDCCVLVNNEKCCSRGDDGGKVCVWIEFVVVVCGWFGGCHDRVWVLFFCVVCLSLMLFPSFLFYPALEVFVVALLLLMTQTLCFFCLLRSGLPERNNDFLTFAISNQAPSQQNRTGNTLE